MTILDKPRPERNETTVRYSGKVVSQVVSADYADWHKADAVRWRELAERAYTLYDPYRESSSWADIVAFRSDIEKARQLT